MIGASFMAHMASFESTRSTHGQHGLPYTVLDFLQMMQCYSIPGNRNDICLSAVSIVRQNHKDNGREGRQT